MSNPLCCKPAPPAGWDTVASLLQSEAFLSAIRQAREAHEAASPLEYCGDDDDSCVPCAAICPTVRLLRESLHASCDRVEELLIERDDLYECIRRDGEELDTLHALLRDFASKCELLTAFKRSFTWRVPG